MKSSLLAILLLLCSSVSYAQGTITDLEEGETAPFSGILLSPVAMAELTTQIDFLTKEHALNLEYQKQLLTTEHQLELGELRIEYDSLHFTHIETVKIKNEEIKGLHSLMEEYEKPNNELWLGIGFVSGVVLTVGMYLLVAETVEFQNDL